MMLDQQQAVITAEFNSIQWSKGAIQSMRGSERTLSRTDLLWAARNLGLSLITWDLILGDLISPLINMWNRVTLSRLMQILIFMQFWGRLHMLEADQSLSKVAADSKVFSKNKTMNRGQLSSSIIMIESYSPKVNCQVQIPIKKEK